MARRQSFSDRIGLKFRSRSSSSNRIASKEHKEPEIETDSSAWRNFDFTWNRPKEESSSFWRNPGKQQVSSSGRHYTSGRDEEDCGEDQQRCEDIHIEHTMQDPIGRLLLQLVKDNMELKDKVGQDGTNINIDEFCTAFYTKAQLDKEQFNRNFKSTEEELSLIHI